MSALLFPQFWIVGALIVALNPITVLSGIITAHIYRNAGIPAAALFATFVGCSLVLAIYLEPSQRPNWGWVSGLSLFHTAAIATWASISHRSYRKKQGRSQSSDAAAP